MDNTCGRACWHDFKFSDVEAGELDGLEGQFIAMDILVHCQIDLVVQSDMHSRQATNGLAVDHPEGMVNV